MLGTLLESNPLRQRRRASAVASILVHTAAIAGAIVATASARTELPPEDRALENGPVFVPVPDDQRRGPRAPSRSGRRDDQRSTDYLGRTDGAWCRRRT